jgi:hypothetical protein
VHSSPNIHVIKSRRIRLAGHVECRGDSRCAHWVLVGRPEGRKPLGRPTHRLEDDIKMDLQEVRCGARTGLIWLRIQLGGWFLRMQQQNFKFCKMWGIPQLANDPLASEGLFHGVG